MTLNEARNVLTKDLTAIYDKDELRNVVDLVLEHITNMPRMEQVKSKPPYLTCTQLESIDAIAERLKSNEPVQYVLGKAWFAGLKFKVNKNVLIPRPETEELVDWVVKESQNPIAIGSKGKSQNILDVGTGSGCIAIAIKNKLPLANITAIDVCSEALFTASENAIEHNTEIDFILLDFLDEDKWGALGQFDIIVSNPPYVKQNEKDSMHARVKEFEPHLALFVPDNDALLFYRKLSDFSRQHLKPGGALFVEINEAFGNTVASMLQSAGFSDVDLKKDMQGKDRMLKASV